MPTVDIKKNDHWILNYKIKNMIAIWRNKLKTDKKKFKRKIKEATAECQDCFVHDSDHSKGEKRSAGTAWWKFLFDDMSLRFTHVL